MKYPFKVIVAGKVYGAADTLAEAQKVAKAQGGYVARIANPDLLTGKIRQREDGGHYVRTRKDKRPAEVDVTADQVAGDWRTQLAHSGHAPTPKPPKAPKARAPKAAKPDGRYRNQWAEMARLRVVEDDATRFEAMGATCTLVIRANPFETGAYLASLYDPQGGVLKQGSSGVGGTMDDALTSLESGHAPAPKAPKAPKGRAPKAGKPKAPAPAPMPATQVTDKDFYALGDRQVSDLVQVLWLELRTKRDAIGFCAALCEDVNFSGPKLPTPDFRDTTPDVSEVAKQLDWDIGRVGVFCWSLLTQYNAREEADEVKRATKQEMQESSDAEPPRPRPRQPRPEVGQSQSFQLAAARYPKLSQKRLKLLAMAIDLGASDAAIAVFAAAKTVAPNSATVIVPFGRYATETRNDGFARTRTKPNYRYAEKGPSGWILDNKSPYYSFADWEVVSKGPHDQETREMYHVGQYNVGGSPWTYAMLDK